MDSNNSNENDKLNKKKVSQATSNESESNRIRNQVKKNIRDIFKNTKDKPITEKVKILNSYKNSND